MRFIYFVVIATGFSACFSPASDPRLLATQAFNAKNYDSALVVLSGMVAQQEDLPFAYSLKGRAHYNVGQFHEAISSLDSACLLSPNEPNNYLYLAIVYSLTNELEKALATCQQGLKHSQKSVELMETQASVYSQLGRFAEAEAVYSQLLKMDSTSYDNWVKRGTARKNKKDFTGALEDYGRAVALDRSRRFAFEERGGLLMHLEQYKLAAGDFTSALELATDSMSNNTMRAISYNYRGWSNYHLGNLADARKDIELSIALMPNNANAYKNLAVVMLNTQSVTDSACQLLVKAQLLGYKNEFGNDVDSLLAVHCK